MNNAISSFVIISNCLNSGQDSIDAFIPFVIHLFYNKGYVDVSIETICKDFKEEYGLQIPRHPMETILNRMKPQFIKKENKKIYINQSEIKKKASLINFDEEFRKYNWLIEHFIDFCITYSTPIEVNREEADTLFTNLLKSHDVDIIFAAYSEEEIGSLIPDVLEIENSDKYFLINKFVHDLLQKGGEFAEYLIDSAVGHKYASVILYREFSNIRGKGACKNYYLDVGILFDLSGINKSFRKKAAEDLLSILSLKGSNLFIFRHNYEEFMRIIESTLVWIENETYNASKASRTLQHFKDLGYGINEIQFFISQVGKILESNNITIANSLDPNINQFFQIDRDALRGNILDVYNSKGNLFDIEDREETLELDITSIEYIYKLRKGKTPANLNDAEFVFLTSNAGLALAANKFEQITLSRGFFTIPAALTDTFVGTFVWIQEPTQLAEEFNRSKMISYTNAALQPRSNVMQKFSNEVKKAQQNPDAPISEQNASLLLSTSLARKLLAEKTLGDPNRITSQTPYEIMAEFEAELIAEEIRKTKKAEQDALNSEAEKEKYRDDLKRQTENTNTGIQKIAKFSRYFLVVLMFLISAILIRRIVFTEPRTQFIKNLDYVFTLLSFVFGGSILLFGKNFEKFIYSKLYKIFFIKEQ